MPQARRRSRIGTALALRDRRDCHDFLMLPTLIVIPMSFSESQYLEFPPREWSLRWYRNYFGSVSWMQATATSFKAGSLR